MGLNGLESAFGFIGGLGMFLYGMSQMSDGMQRGAGDKMQKFLGMLTNNHFMAVGLGLLITAIIQSSSATTVMVVGFVSAGMMNLVQAAGVIMGANIGTTVTAWIVSVSQLGDSAVLCKPEFYAPLLVGIGAMVLSFVKSNKVRVKGEIVLGLGFLFVGLKMMSSSIAPYTDLPIFSKIFLVLGENPLLGIIAGCVVTAIIQSSSASVGILQTLALSGSISKAAAIYITLGQNIGTCVTALLSCVGSSKIAKRAAVIHLLFNVIGSAFFSVAAFIIFHINVAFAKSPINSFEISLFHTIFNLTATVILSFFVNQLVALSGLIVGQKDEEIKQQANTMVHLDERILSTPALALETARREIIHMGEIVMGNLERAINASVTKDEEVIKEIFSVEKNINIIQEDLTNYLVKIDNLSISEKQKLKLSHLYYCINDLERIGDHCDNIAENCMYLIEKNLQFSESGISELNSISEAAKLTFDNALNALRTGKLDYVRKVNKYEDEVDMLERELRDRHMNRLTSGECRADAGIIYLDIIGNLERISDHAKNIGEYVTSEVAN